MAELSLHEAVNDDAMITKIAFPELIAQEAKYHKECHQLYMANARRFPNKERVETAYEKALKSFKDYIENKLPQECRAIEMKQLLEKF